MTPLQMALEFCLQLKKAVEAAALLLKLNENRPMKDISLLKMLYLSDRLALQEIEQSITNDCSISMKYGAVLNGISELIKGNNETKSRRSSHDDQDAVAYWSQFIQTDGSEVSLKADPGLEELCEAEIEIVENIYRKWEHVDPFDTQKWTNDLPEWQAPEKVSSLPIHPEEILRSVGKSVEEIDVIRAEIEREYYLDNVISRTATSSKGSEEKAAKKALI